MYIILYPFKRYAEKWAMIQKLICDTLELTLIMVLSVDGVTIK